MEIFILLGSALAGHRLIMEQLGGKLNYHHLSIANLIRQELANQTSLGQLFRSFVDKGEILPTSLVQEMLESALNQCIEKEGILIDGYPKSPLQAELLLDFLFQNPKNRIRAFFFFTPKEAFIARWKSTHHWNDSDENLILERINNNEREANEIKTYLESRIEVITIDGEGTIDEVVSRVLAAV